MDDILRRVCAHPCADTPFDQVVEGLLHYTERPVHSLQEMREARSTKVKGDLFETFCARYLEWKGYTVWRCHDIPLDVCAALGMTRFDVGIDLVAEKHGRYSAVQCKFKRPRGWYGVNWREVSTFFSLCFRTQQQANWQHHIVMTNTKSVRRMGNASPYDKTYAYGTFKKLTTIHLLELVSPAPPPPVPPPSGPPAPPPPGPPATVSLDQLREARLKRFG